MSPIPMPWPDRVVIREVGLRDGLAAVLMGLAAQASAASGQAIDLTQGDYALSGLDA